MQLSAFLPYTRAARLAGVASVAFILAAAAQAQAVWFVTDAGIAGSAGTSWTSPTTLDNALASSAFGDEIRVKEGVYRPGVAVNPLDQRTRSFLITHGVKIRGGFLGTETTGKPLGNPLLTIFDGVWNNPGAPTLPDDYVFHVVRVATADKVFVDGCLIRNGYAHPPTGTTFAVGDPRLRGAGVFMAIGSNVELESVKFNENHAQESGGALTARSSSLRMKQCHVLDNTAANGGGMFLDFMTSADLVNVRIHRNQSPSGTTGGGISIRGNAGLTRLANVDFQDNFVNGTGAAVFVSGGNLATFFNCTFSQNSAPVGGAQSIDDAGNAGGLVDLRNCIFWNTFNLNLPGHFALAGGGGPFGTGLAVSATFSDIQMGVGTLFPGASNTNADPSFNLFLCAPGNDSLANPLLAATLGSAALLPADFADIDGDGDSSEVLPIDREKGARVQGGAVNMGAFETTYCPLLDP